MLVPSSAVCHSEPLLFSGEESLLRLCFLVRTCIAAPWALEGFLASLRNDKDVKLSLDRHCH